MKADLELERQKTRLDAARLGVDTVGLEMTVLREAVRRITGSDDPAMRESQVQLMQQITAAMRGYSDNQHVSAEAPTGTGKSLAGVVPAAVAALRGERTVISTESLALQAQIMDKDAPLVMDCVEALTGVRPTYAVHKGWSNYVCAKQTIDTIDTITNNPVNRRWTAPGAEIKDAAAKLVAGVSVSGPKPKRTKGKVAAKPSGPDQALELFRLVAWAIQQVAEERSGDKNTYTGAITGREWEHVSVASGECLGKECPLADWCLPKKARAKVAVADLIVTNHALLGVQAAKSAKTVLGSAKLGRVDHLIVDECHALPQVVRNQGAAEVSERSLHAVVAAYARSFGDERGGKSPLELAGESAIADVVAEMTDRINRQKDKGPVRLAADAGDPLAMTGPKMQNWLEEAKDRIDAQLALTPYGSVGQIKLMRLRSRVENTASALKAVREGQPGVARWMEMITGRDGLPYPTAQSSPVDVAPMLRSQLWVVDQPSKFDDSGFEGEPDDGEESGERSREPITVATMSATVPRGFTVQAGLSCRTTVYPTPFDDAYDGSALYVPILTRDNAQEVCRDGWNGRLQFDVKKHPAWAAERIVRLVTANRGSALVLSATAEAGRLYAAQLRAALSGAGIQVLSQFDGLSLREITAAWKADHSAVLVGTRSLMTGVDAPGETNSLVIVDRIPRAAGNPVDDARVEALVENDVVDDKWAGDRMVYVADAALLLAQAAGRLIRHATDRGMVAVLDPRLLKTSVVKYAEQTRQQLVDPLMMFGDKIVEEDEALAWLAARQAALTAA